MHDDHITGDNGDKPAIDDMSYEATKRRDYTDEEAAFMIGVQEAIFATRGDLVHTAALAVITALGLLELNIGTAAVIEVLEQTVSSMKAGQHRVN